MVNRTYHTDLSRLFRFFLAIIFIHEKVLFRFENSNNPSKFMFYRYIWRFDEKI